MGREILSLCDNLAHRSREHQLVGLVAEDSSHCMEVSSGESVGFKKT